jgi:hypothetical protein
MYICGVYTAMSYAPRKVMMVRIGGVMLDVLASNAVDLRNKSWKPECVGSFNMDWRILVFYPEPEARDKIY